MRHQPGGHREKVRLILPVHVLRIHQPQVGLVHEGGGLEAAACSFAAHAPTGDPLQLLDGRGESVERARFRRPRATPVIAESRSLTPQWRHSSELWAPCQFLIVLPASRNRRRMTQ